MSLYSLGMNLCSLLAGYLLHEALNGRVQAGKQAKGKAKQDAGEDASSGEESSDDSDGDVNDDVSCFTDLKMVLCIRTDLKMGKGKIVAQACHGATGALKKAEYAAPKLYKKFWRGGSAKIALKCPSEGMMLNIQAMARELKLVSYVVCDAGRTQIAAGSRTVVAIGPAPVSEINKITGPGGAYPLKLM
jgi:peptidyl-tRNA hydrolase, PTH2 family